MEMTENTLEQIVFSIVYLKIRMDLLQSVVMHNDRDVMRSVEDLVDKAVTMPQFQRACRELRESWKEGTPMPLPSFSKFE